MLSFTESIFSRNLLLRRVRVGPRSSSHREEFLLEMRTATEPKIDAVTPAPCTTGDPGEQPRVRATKRMTKEAKMCSERVVGETSLPCGKAEADNSQRHTPQASTERSKRRSSSGRARRCGMCEASNKRDAPPFVQVDRLQPSRLGRGAHLRPAEERCRAASNQSMVEAGDPMHQHADRYEQSARRVSELAGGAEDRVIRQM
jgi:hypothetical protein